MRWFDEKRTARLEIRIEPALKELLGDLADSKNTNVSDYIRTLCIKAAKPYNKKLQSK